MLARRGARRYHGMDVYCHDFASADTSDEDRD
jgi:hypothetical protein